MAKLKTAIIASGDSIALGPLELPVDMLATLAPEDTNKNGIVLANERIKFMVDMDGKLVNVTASIYIQRDAVDDNETAEVAKVAAERAAAKTQREQDERAKSAREVKAAFELGQSSTMHAIRNVADLAAGAAALSKLGK